MRGREAGGEGEESGGKGGGKRGWGLPVHPHVVGWGRIRHVRMSQYNDRMLSIMIGYPIIMKRCQSMMKG